MSDEERIVRYTGEEIDEMLARGESKSDWARVDRLTEEEIEASIDVEEEGEIDWDSVQVGIPAAKQQITVRFDTDIIEWFKGKGPGYQTRMNRVLRSYVEAQRDKNVS